MMKNQKNCHRKKMQALSRNLKKSRKGSSTLSPRRSISVIRRKRNRNTGITNDLLIKPMRSSLESLPRGSPRKRKTMTMRNC